MLPPSPQIIVRGGGGGAQGEVILTCTSSRNKGFTVNHRESPTVCSPILHITVYYHNSEWNLNGCK